MLRALTILIALICLAPAAGAQSAAPIDMLSLVVFVGLMIKIHEKSLTDKAFRVHGWLMFALIVLVIAKTLAYIAIMTVRSIVLKCKQLG